MKKMNMNKSEEKKGFYVGDPSREIQFNAPISRLNGKDDKDIILMDIMAENGTKMARIEGNLHYPLQFLLNVQRFCDLHEAKVFVCDSKINFALDSWYHYQDGKFILSDFKSYNDLLQHLWFNFCMNSILDYNAEVVYL